MIAMTWSASMVSHSSRAAAIARRCRAWFPGCRGPPRTARPERRISAATFCCVASEIVFLKTEAGNPVVRVDHGAQRIGMPYL